MNTSCGAAVSAAQLGKRASRPLRLSGNRMETHPARREKGIGYEKESV
jgi:hypothetical protein